MAKTPTDIRSLARAHTETALRVLAGIMEQDSAPHAARVSAATALLDRGWGKPLQSIEVENITSRVIRAPTVSADAQDWAKQHVPPGMSGATH